MTHKFLLLLSCQPCLSLTIWQLNDLVELYYNFSRGVADCTDFLKNDNWKCKNLPRKKYSLNHNIRHIILFHHKKWTYSSPFLDNKLLLLILRQAIVNQCLNFSSPSTMVPIQVDSCNFLNSHPNWI